MILRPGTADDLPEVLALERAAVTAPHWPAAVYAGILLSAERCLIVGEVEGLVIGFAVGALLAEEAELENVVVQPDVQGRGIGSALVKAILAWAHGVGACAVLLEVRAGSEGARRVYERSGFVPAGVRKGYYAGPQEDALVMRCPLA